MSQQSMEPNTVLQQPTAMNLSEASHPQNEVIEADAADEEFEQHGSPLNDVACAPPTHPTTPDSLSNSVSRGSALLDHLSASAKSSATSSAINTPDRFLQLTPPGEQRTEGRQIRDAKYIQKDHQQHIIALAPIITDVLVRTIIEHDTGIKAPPILSSTELEDEDDDDNTLTILALARRRSKQSIDLTGGKQHSQPQHTLGGVTPSPQRTQSSSALVSQPNFIYYETAGIQDAKGLLIYVRYFMLETWSSASVFIASLILMDRFIRKNSENGFRLTYCNAFKLFVIASLVAGKVLETVMCNNRTFAAAARLPLKSINLTEQRFLSHLEFDVCILRSEWEAYAKRILAEL